MRYNNANRQSIFTAMTQASSPQWVEACLIYARASMAKKPPPSSRRVVVPPDSHPLVELAIPSFLCPTTNIIQRMNRHLYREMKRACLTAIMRQLLAQPKLITGRPLVLAARVVSSSVDQNSDWSKVPVDCLLVMHNGIGVLQNDDPESIDLHTWREKGFVRNGFVWLRVFEEGTPYKIGETWE